MSDKAVSEEYDKSYIKYEVVINC